jgi:hypothetical protein
MKKIKLIVIAVIAVIFTACTDDTNQYSTYYFTDSELNRAFRQCLELSSDTAITHLCVPNSDEFGFYNYSDQTYRIGLPTSANGIKDTLMAHGQGDLIDSLILKTNLAASYCGSGLTNYFDGVLETMSFADPYRILEGDSNAVTNYFILHNYNGLLAQSVALMTTNMSAQGATEAWNNVINAYYQITGQVISIDYTNFAAQKITNSILNEMKKEETQIRTLVSHRGDETGKLYIVFGTLDQ